MDRKNLPFVSIIIPTYNRIQPLARARKSLSVQNYPKFEIIVVDQKLPNLPRARNLGIKKAKGEIILFVDDDISARQNLVVNHVLNYQDKNVAAVTGRVVRPDVKNQPDFMGVGRITPWGTVKGGYSSKIKQEVGNVIGCNMSFRKNIFAQAGLFDENFIGNALREETDMALRIKKLGKKIVFEPKAEVEHNFYPTGGCRMNGQRKKWFHDFFHNESYFFFKWINRYWWPVFWLTRWSWFVRSKSLILPWQGIYHGWKTYRRWKSENRS